MKRNTVILLSKAKPLLYLLNNFKFYISQFSKTLKFLGVLFCNIWKNRHYEGKARSNPICLDCHANARNDSENNFAILNLIKSFLTSFTFDNLSERIKNLYLVINQFNFFTKGGYSHEEYQNNFHLHGRRSFSYGFIYKL